MKARTQFAALLALGSVVCALLGAWQWSRHLDRVERNAQIAEQRSAPPRTVSADESLDEFPEWTHIRLVGSFVPDSSVVILHRTFAGQAGTEVVTLLETGEGRTFAIDRGWLPTQGDDPLAAVPDPPPGVVEVVGWVRRDGTGSSVVPHDNMARAISGELIAAAADREASGFVMMDSLTPAPAIPLTPPQLPEATVGPHRFYAAQWWVFTVLGLIGAGAVLRGSKASEQPAVDRNHDAGEVRRSR